VSASSVGDGRSDALFPIPDADGDATAFIVMDDDFYANSHEGTLWHADLASKSPQPVPLEQQGRYDDDDYQALLAADRDAIYWQAGADRVAPTSNDDPLALFRTCR